jgi:hypothetical protein
MKVQILACVATMALAFGTTASARTLTKPFAQYDPASARGESTSVPPYGQGSGSAFNVVHPGDGSDPSYLPDQQEPRHESSYSVGTGASQVGDGSSPFYLRDQQGLLHEPGYSVGTGAAQVGDGSSPSYMRDQQELLREPGYGVGTAASYVSSNR